MKNTQGVVLIVCLLFLTVMSLLGLTALSQSSLSERMAGNMMNRNLAFQAAETALIDAEDWLATQTTAPTAVASCSTPPCAVWQSGILSVNTATASWWNANGTPYRGSIGSNIIAAQPTSVIEQLQFIPDDSSPGSNSQKGTYFYQVTAHGTGGNTLSEVVVQSIYAARFN